MKMHPRDFDTPLRRFIGNVVLTLVVIGAIYVLLKLLNALFGGL